MTRITLTDTPKPHPPVDSLGFGNYFTDHMFLMDYCPEKGWYDARIVPHGPIGLDPAAMVLHYGQEVFEGLKAYRSSEGKINLFRPLDNIRRFNRSCARLSIPEINEELYLEAMKELVRVENVWVPDAPDASLYLRPFLIATDPFIGVRASRTYLFIILLSPVGAYYPGGITPTSIYVEDEDVRAVRGGLGFAKTGANYAATIRAQTRAKEKGFTQVMWLDALERKYVEEVGTSNAFFVISGKVITPPLGGSILPGITRASCIDLLRGWNVPVEERNISIDEVFSSHEDETLEEIFATGTAAVVSPVGMLCYQEREINIGSGDVGPIARRLYDALTDIQWARKPDSNNWIVNVM